MSTTATATRRSSEVVERAGWLGATTVVRAEEAWASTDGQVCGRPKWL